MAPRWPKMSQDSHKMAQRGSIWPNKGPIWLQDGRKMVPSWLHVGPKMAVGVGLGCQKWVSRRSETLIFASWGNAWQSWAILEHLLDVLGHLEASCGYHGPSSGHLRGSSRVNLGFQIVILVEARRSSPKTGANARGARSVASAQARIPFPC